MPLPLSPRQADVLAYIKDYIDLYAHSPSYVQLAERFNCSTNNVRDHVLALVRKGYVTTIKNQHYSIAVLPFDGDPLVRSRRNSKGRSA